MLKAKFRKHSGETYMKISSNLAVESESQSKSNSSLHFSNFALKNSCHPSDEAFCTQSDATMQKHVLFLLVTAHGIQL